MPRRTLTLRSETLGDLTLDDMRRVGGGTTGGSLSGRVCVTQWPTFCVECPSAECPSNPLDDCTVLHPTTPETCLC